MAVPSVTQFFIGPEDGWVQISTGSIGFMRVSAVPHTHPFYIIDGSSAPANLIGGALICHKPFWFNVNDSTNWYVRTANPGPDNQGSNKVRFDVVVLSASSGGGGSGSNAAAGPTGSAVPASAGYTGFNVAGNLVGVSSSNPLPITGSISATNPSVSTTGAAVPTSATYVGASNGTNLTALKVAGTGIGLIVGGAVADGSAPTTFSQALAGIDGGGLKRTLLTTTAGLLQTQSLGSAGTPYLQGADSALLNSDVIPSSAQVPTVTGATYNASTGVVTFTANSQLVVIDTAGYNTLSLSLGTGVATISGSTSNINPPPSTVATGQFVRSDGAVVTTLTTIGANYTAACGGRYIQLQATAFTSTQTLTIRLLNITTPIFVSGATTITGAGGAGAALAGNPLMAAISDGTNTQRVSQTTFAASNGNTGVGVVAVEEAGRPYVNITTATTTTVKSTKGFLHSIIINTLVASATITIFDNTTGTGTKIGTITLPSTITGDPASSLIYDLSFSTGLTIVTSGATDITVVYR